MYMILSNSECYLFLFQGLEIESTQLVGLKIIYQPSQIIRYPTCTCIFIHVLYTYIYTCTCHELLICSDFSVS